jgi:hypothetical protein
MFSVEVPNGTKVHLSTIQENAIPALHILRDMGHNNIDMFSIDGGHKFLDFVLIQKKYFVIVVAIQKKSYDSINTIIVFISTIIHHGHHTQ